jgi:hypothetical protein
VGIFASRSRLFTRYRGRLQFRDKVMGGTPKDPKLIEAWLRAKAGIEDAEEIRRALLRTMSDLGAEVNPEMTFDELTAASETLASSRETNGFKRDDNGLYLESRQLKAGLKESTNILYAGEKWGATRRLNAKQQEVSGYQGKSPKGFVAERVFVAPDHLILGRPEPDGIEMMIGHVTGPDGPRSTLGYYEYVRRGVIEFDVLVTRDSIKEEWWVDLWTHMEENGLGALRSQGYGKFDLLAWDQVDITSAVPEV